MTALDTNQPTRGKRRANITPVQEAQIEQWHRERSKLGNTKAIAYRAGVSEGQVKTVVARLKLGDIDGDR